MSSGTTNLAPEQHWAFAIRMERGFFQQLRPGQQLCTLRRVAGQLADEQRRLRAGQQQQHSDLWRKCSAIYDMQPEELIRRYG